MKKEIIECIETEKLIVIVRGIDRNCLIPLAEAMYNGGVRLLEVTYGSVTDEETAENIKLLSEHFNGKMYIGAGTVLTEKQVEMTYKSGGKFIISPDCNECVIKKSNELGLVSMPGALTPTEIQNAHKYGADFVKIFPASNLGPEYIKAVRAPLSHIKLLAVGGINYDNIPDYIKVGVSGFGVGSNIIDKKALAEKDFAKITELAKSYVSQLK